MKLVSLLASVMLVMAVQAMHAQTTRGTMLLSTGTHFMVAFPEVWADSLEKKMPKPMVLYIASRFNTKAWITTPAESNTLQDLVQEIDIVANVPFEVSIPFTYLSQTSEIATGNGISIVSERPISVEAFQSWLGNGESDRHLPISAWGTSYYTMNLYQDRFGVSTAYQHRPGQILIISAEDETTVTFVTTVDTEGHPTHGGAAKGVPKSIILQKGETYLIKAKITTDKYRSDSTDLSGTYIVSNKPIAVISGHTKGAIMRMPDILPPTGQFAAKAHFVRNNLHDVMLPIEFAGTSFVTVPCMYTPTRVVGQNATGIGIENDRGDVIRFVGITNNTLVKRMKKDGSGFDDVFTLQRGETKILPAEESACLWTSSSPILMGQYGKSYAKILPPVMAKDQGGDEAQGHPTIESGMPMLQMIPPIDRWINEAVFDAPEGMDNFFNIVFKNTEITQIFFDGRSLSTAFGGAKRLLTGTEYAYIRTPFGSGKHVVTTSDSNIRWTAWSYGSLDGLQQGRAYGSPLGVDYTRTCNDSLSITTAPSCNTLSGSFNVHGDSCAGMAMIYLTSASNAQLQAIDIDMIGSKNATFAISKVDKTKPSTATIRGVTLSGRFLEQYVQIGVDSSFASSKPKHEFGDVEPGIVFTDTLTLTNFSTLQSLTARLRFRLNDPAFSIVDTLPITLAMGESKKVVVTATGVEEGIVLNDLLAITDCGTEWTLTSYSSSYNRPKFRSSNVNFGVVPSNTPTKRTATITNIGLTTFTIIDHSVEVQEGAPEAFLVTADGERDLDSVIPYRLAPNKTLTITATFDPKGVVGTCRQKYVFFTADRDTAVVMTLNGLATPDTTTSVSGDAATTGLSFSVTPQPINEAAMITLTTVERGSATIELIDLLGNVITSRTEQVTSSPQSFAIGGMSVPNGTYSIRVSANGRQASARIIIAR